MSLHFVLFLKQWLQHVKMYCLTDDGQWCDQRTCHVTIDYFEVMVYSCVLLSTHISSKMKA
jgi:hypothetical protein